jgi:hypothetical protein
MPGDSKILPSPKAATSRGERARVKFVPRAVPLTLACILALVTAIECHAVATGPGSAASWNVSLAYGMVFWLWWAAVVELLRRAGKRWSFTLRVSSPAMGVQCIVAIVAALLHLGILELSAHWIARAGPELEGAAAYSGLQFFNVWRFGVEFLVYGLIWSTCAAVNTQMAAQQDALRSLALEGQLSGAHLRALQMQLESPLSF